MISSIRTMGVPFRLMATSPIVRKTRPTQVPAGLVKARDITTAKSTFQ